MKTNDKVYQLLAAYLDDQWNQRYVLSGRMLTREELDRNRAARRAARQEVK